MSLSDKIKELIAEQGIEYKEKARTIYTTCPVCGRNDKFSILKENGACICYRASCSFGKGFFPKWLALTANISIAEAKRKIYSNKYAKYISDDEIISLFNTKQSPVAQDNTLQPIEFPQFGMIKIDSEQAIDGLNYLNKRGIDLQIALKHNIYYNPLYRRVIIPVTMNHKVYGYQARAIDPVDDQMRIRNNPGFQRDKLLMFADNLENVDFCIICEGPFDAMKFDKVGGYVCTMGKNISNTQLQLILRPNIKKIYIALDDDAAQNMNELLEKVDRDVLKIEIPDTCRQRCAQLNKKADFGECTLDEAAEAFYNATIIDKNYVFLYLPETWK